MAKETKTTPETDAKVTAPQAIPMSLTEFCIKQSKSDRRVELLSGFEFTERSEGRLGDTEANYAARYAAFMNQPA